jgi:hypothetical protein
MRSNAPIRENIEIGRAARRRRTQKFPFRNRWLIVKARDRSTWRQVWDDLIYLVTG